VGRHRPRRVVLWVAVRAQRSPLRGPGAGSMEDRAVDVGVVRADVWDRYCDVESAAAGCGGADRPGQCSAGAVARGCGDDRAGGRVRRRAGAPLAQARGTGDGGGQAPFRRGRAVPGGAVATVWDRNRRAPGDAGHGRPVWLHRECRGGVHRGDRLRTGVRRSCPARPAGCCRRRPPGVPRARG